MRTKYNKGDIVRDATGLESEVCAITILYTLTDGEVREEAGLTLVKKSEDVDDILAGLCDMLDVSVAMVLSETRARYFALRRQIIMYVLRTKYHMTTLAIGELLNRRHCTISFGVKNIQNLLDSYDEDTVKLIKLVL